MKKRVIIYAYGRFNKVMARLLASYYDILVYHHSERGVTEAKKDGYNTISSLGEIKSNDIIFIGVPINMTKVTLENLLPYLSEDNILVEQCSVKEKPLEWCKDLLGNKVQYMITHPMFGPDSAKDSFKGLNYVISESESTCNGEFLEEYKLVLEKEGLNIVNMTASEHDREAAYSQGITHFIGRLLGELKLKPSKIATSGYKSLFDIVKNTCNDTEELFIDLQRNNRYTAEMRKSVEEAFYKVDNKLNEIE